MKNKPTDNVPRLYRINFTAGCLLTTCALIVWIAQVVGCARQDTRVADFFSTNAPAASIASAGLYLQELQRQNQLPGISKDDHGNMEAEKITLTKSNLNEISYPLRRTFIVTKDGDSSSYHYTLEQSSKDAEWKLERAWHIDSTGHLIEEFPIGLTPNINTNSTPK